MYSSVLKKSYIIQGGNKMSKVMKTMDGNAAAAHVAYAFTEVAL